MNKLFTKLMSVFLCILLLFSFTGCSNAYDQLIEHIAQPQNFSESSQNYVISKSTKKSTYGILFSEEDGLAFKFIFDDGSFQVQMTGLDSKNDMPSIAFRFTSSGVKYTASGYINRNTFKEGEHIEDFKTNNFNDFFWDTQELCETGTHTLLSCINDIIKNQNIGLTLADLGFTNYT